MKTSMTMLKMVMAIGVLSCGMVSWPVRAGGATEAAGAAKDQTLIPAPGEYRMVDMVLKGAGSENADIRVRGATRNGRLPVFSELSVRDVISEIKVDEVSIKGDFYTRFYKHNNPERYAINAVISKGRITGTWSCDQRKGTLSGKVKTEEELRKENSFATQADWPCWSGPFTGMAATPCGLKLVEEFGSDARLVWRSEELTPQGPGNSLNYARLALVQRSNGGGSSLVVADGKVFINYYQPAGDEYMKDDAGGVKELDELAKKTNPPVAEVNRWMKEKFLVKADDVVVCMDAVTGKTLWKNVFAGKSLNQPSHKGGCVNNTPCTGGGKVFAMGPSGCLHGMDIATGKVLWERTGMSSQPVVPWSGARNQCTAPIYVDGVLILPDHGSTLTGIDPETGKDLWKLPGKGNGFQVPAKCNLKGKEYVVSMTGEGKTAAAIEAKTGKILWEIPLPASPTKGVSTHGDLMVVVSGGITTPDEDGSKALCTGFRLSADKTEQVWQTSVPDANAHAVAALDGRYVAVKGTTKQSHLLDATSGKILATYLGETGQNECHVALMENRAILSIDGAHGHSEMIVLGATPETFSKLLCTWNQPHPQTTSYHNKYMTWPMVEGRLFMRGADGVYCYDLRKNKAALIVDAARVGLSGDVAFKAILPLCADPDPDVRVAAVRAIQRSVSVVKSDAVRAAALKAVTPLAKDPDQNVCSVGLDSLGAFGLEALSALESVVADGSAAGRVDAVRAVRQLGAYSDKRTDAILSRLMNDSEKDVLWETLLTVRLGGTNCADLVGQVLKLIDSEDPRVSAAAMEAYVEVAPGKPPVPRPAKLESNLVAMLLIYNEPDRAYGAVRMIRALGDADALRIFVSVLNGKEAIQGIRAAVGLGDMGSAGKPGIPALKEAMKKWGWSGAFMRAAKPALDKLEKAP